MADLNKALQADLFARYHWARDNYEPLAAARSPLTRVWVMRALAGMAERVAAFVPEEDHPGEAMSAEAFDDPITAAAAWSTRADEAAAELTDAESALDARRRPLEAARVDILEAQEDPAEQERLAPAYLDAFRPLWADDPAGLWEEALFAAMLMNNLLGDRGGAAALYEEVGHRLQSASAKDPVLRDTAAQTLFRAAVAHRAAGQEERAEELATAGRGLAGL